jgi:hypothetical protein
MSDPFRDFGAEIVAEVGGVVDETHVTLGIYGPDVRPDEISAVLRHPPTRAHQRGDARPGGQPPWHQGAWVLTLKGRAPVGPDELLQQLLSELPNDLATWTGLRSKHSVRIVFGIFVAGWNQGFELAPSSMTMLARLGVPVGFDIYADGGAEADD